jgi:hypothetical protein
MAARCLLLTENAHWEERKGIPYRLTAQSEQEKGQKQE